MWRWLFEAVLVPAAIALPIGWWVGSCFRVPAIVEAQVPPVVMFNFQPDDGCLYVREGDHSVCHPIPKTPGSTGGEKREM